MSTPMAAVVQIDAAVVRPRTVSPSLKITPAPRKPMPVMIPCAMRVGSTRTDSPAGNHAACEVATIMRMLEASPTRTSPSRTRDGPNSSASSMNKTLTACWLTSSCAGRTAESLEAFRRGPHDRQYDSSTVTSAGSDRICGRIRGDQQDLHLLSTHRDFADFGHGRSLFHRGGDLRTGQHPWDWARLEG